MNSICLSAHLVLGREHQAGAARQARQHLAGLGQHMLQRGAAARRLDLRLDHAALLVGEIAEFHEGIDEEAQPLLRRKPARRDMRRIDEAEMLQIAHDVAHRRRRQRVRKHTGQVARADRLAVLKIGIDDQPENVARARVQRLQGLVRDRAWSWLRLVSTIEDIDRALANTTPADGVFLCAASRMRLQAANESKRRKDPNAPFPTSGRRNARHLLRARDFKACRRLLPRQVRRHACAVHREPRGKGSRLDAQYRQGLGHGRVRHAAARHRRAHAPRSLHRQARAAGRWKSSG